MPEILRDITWTAVLSSANIEFRALNRFIKILEEQIDRYEEGLQQHHGFFQPELDEIPLMVRHLLTSNFISAISLFEASLLKICNEVELKLGNDLLPKHFKGSTLQSIQTYLSKIAKVEFDSFDSEWKKMQNYYIVRNCYVHHNGLTLHLNNERYDSAVKDLENINHRFCQLEVKDAKAIESFTKVATVIVEGIVCQLELLVP